MAVEHWDVLIIGAGLSGVGAAHAIQKHCKGRSFAILEARDAIGGTWDLFRYPGVRSDTDMYTLGYAFQPWLRKESMADGASILSYVRDTAREHGIDQRVRFGHRAKSAVWSSADARWTLEVEVGPEREIRQYTCGFLYLCSGYYDYAQGFMPEYAGREDFGGQLVHPQFWPQDLDWRGKKVVVIGSGATAVTLVPSMAKEASHVTMLQRSPTYIASLPSVDTLGNFLHRWLPARTAHRLARAKSVAMATLFYQLCRRKPELGRKLLREGVCKSLPRDFDFDTHFKPRYAPWDERVCFVRNGDLFQSISDGRASVVTERIERFTPGGIRLESGRELEADIVVSATGLKLVPCAGLAIQVDGRAVKLGDTYAWRGLMLSGVPNLAFCTGYSNASWTLRADLASRFVTRLLNHMKRKRYASVLPRVDEAGMAPQPLIGLQSGYVLRSVADFPKQGAQAPWRMAQNYYADLVTMRWRSVADAHLVFSRAASSS